MDLMGTLDVAELLGVGHEGVGQLVARADFPGPVGTVNGRTRIWERAQVEQWARERARG
jgi:hypothetical protein